MSNHSDVKSGTSGTPLTYAINFIFVPIVYTIGFIGNSACLYVLLKQVKNSFGYLYQVVVVLNDIVGTLASTLFRLGRVWYGLAYNSGPSSLRSNFLVMAYTAHLGGPATTVCHFVALGVTLCISVDRMLLFYKPFYYKTINKKRAFVISLCVTLTFSVLLNTFDFAAYTVTYHSDGSVYHIDVNKSIVYENFGYRFLIYIRLIARFVLMAAIFVLNVMVIVKYKDIKRSPANQSKKQSPRVLTENTLALFLLLHSFVLGLGQLPLAIACVPISLYPFWTGTTWEGRITADIINTLGAVQWAAGFLFYVGISREFRRTVAETFHINVCRRYWGNDGSVVDPPSREPSSTRRMTIYAAREN